MGYSATSDGNVRSKGTMYLVLNAQGGADHPVASIYRWKGEVHEATEARAFLRSRASLLDELVAYVLARHPYLAWLRAETESHRA